MGFVGILRRSIRGRLYGREFSLCPTEIGDSRKPCGKVLEDVSIYIPNSSHTIAIFCTQENLFFKILIENNNNKDSFTSCMIAVSKLCHRE
jgi:hypothetical protein